MNAAGAARTSRTAIPGNIFLIGMMGAGKSSVGRLLARRLQKTFRDTDHEIERRTGVRIPIVFEIEGEAGFRRRESAMVKELAALDDSVIATGGGAVLDPENRRVMRSRGTVIYLRADVRELWHRTRHDRNRPLLRTEDPLAKLESLSHDRGPLYLDAAHIVIDSGSQSLKVLVGRIERELARWTTAETQGAQHA